MFGVSWTDSALDGLADVYVQVDPQTRAALAASVTGLNARLAAGPMAEGESRGRDTRRVVFSGRMIVWFDVDAPARTVRVYRFRFRR